MTREIIIIIIITVKGMGEQLIIRLLHAVTLCDNYGNHDRGHGSNEKRKNPINKRVSNTQTINRSREECTNHIPLCHAIQ